jgi:ABC-type branched-subunit amino acid transport system ATPase component
MSAPMLEVKDLHAWYGESHVLHGVNFDVREGEVVTLLGRNGAGRTSTLRAIMGLTGSRKGSIRVRGSEVITMATHGIARLGIGYCPEERGIFSSLSAEENLMLPPELAKGGMSVEQIYAMFPNLKERASTISASFCTITGARPSEISSSSNSRAPVRRMRATASICCSPPESRVPWLLARSFRFGNMA